MSLEKKGGNPSRGLLSMRIGSLSDIATEWERKGGGEMWGSYGLFVGLG